MMTQADKTTDNRGEVRPLTHKNAKLEDKIADEKDDEMVDDSSSDERKLDS
jgi:hypothetical protein